MRIALAAIVLVLAAPASGQGIFLHEGEDALSVTAGTAFNDGVADATVGLVLSTRRGLDLSASLGQAPVFEDDALSSVGLGAGWNLDREGPSRASAQVGYSATWSDRIDMIHVLAIGARAGQQIVVGTGVRVVPNVSISVAAVQGDGLQTGAAVDLPMFFESGSIEPYVALSLSLSSERARFVRGLDVPLVGLRGGILL